MSEMESDGLEWYWIVAIVVPTVVVVALLYRLWVKGRSYSKQNQIPGKVVVITGANTGIGKETALELAKRGAKVYMACRSLDKAEAARKEVIEGSGNQNVYVRTLDLGSLKSIRKFAEEFEEPKIDLLINNAGVMMCPRSLTSDGFELQLGTNHLGHFLLTNLLLEKVKAAAPARIINVSSYAHYLGKINKEDLMHDKSYSPWGVYCQSKLANVLFTKELARRLKDSGVKVFTLHPGTINTELTRHVSTSYGRILEPLRAPFTWLFFKTPREGAQTTLTCALDPDLDQTESGTYFSNCRPTKVNPLANDEKLAQWLWDRSVELTEEKPEQGISA